MTEENEEVTEEEEKPVHRLLDILVREVSLVERGANKRKILLRKADGMLGNEVIENEDGTLTEKSDTDSDNSNEDTNDSTNTTEEEIGKQAIPKGVKEASIGMVESAKKKVESLISKVEAMDEVEGEDSLPMFVADELKACASTLRGIGSKYPSPKAKTEKSEGGVEVEKRYASDEKSKKARDILWAAIEEVDSGRFAPEEEKKVVDDLLNLISGVVKTKKEETEKAEKQISSSLKKQLVSALKKISEELDKFNMSLKEAEETDEQSSTPLPKTFADTAEKIAGMLDYITNEYPSKTVKVETGKSPMRIIEEASKKLSVLLAKVKPGQTLDEDSFNQLSELKSLFGSIASSKTEEDVTTEKDGDINKAGAKMAKERRKRFKEAMTTLLALFKEVMPDVDLGSWPTTNEKKKTEKSEDSEVETIKKELEKTKEELSEAKSSIVKLKAKPVSSNVSMVETSQVAKTNGGTDSDDSDFDSWDQALNNPQ